MFTIEGGRTLSPLSLQPGFMVVCEITSTFSSLWKNNQYVSFGTHVEEKARLLNTTNRVEDSQTNQVIRCMYKKGVTAVCESTQAIK